MVAEEAVSPYCLLLSTNSITPMAFADFSHKAPEGIWDLIRLQVSGKQTNTS
jgi:hypothetical protein